MTRRGARRERVPEAAGPAAHEIEPRRGVDDELLCRRPERRKSRPQPRLAAEELPEHLNGRPARPGGKTADAAERRRRPRRPLQVAPQHSLDVGPRPRGDEVGALRDRVRAEDEPRDDPEVASAAAAAGPEEIAVVA